MRKILLQTVITALLSAGTLCSHAAKMKLRFHCRADMDTAMAAALTDGSIRIEQHNTILYIFRLQGTAAMDVDLEIKKMEPVDVFLNTIGAMVYLCTIFPDNENGKTVSVTFPVQYQLAGNKAVCPKCKKSDKTVEHNRRYYWYETTNEGETITTITSDSIPGNGMILYKSYEGKYYCSRDKIKF